MPSNRLLSGLSQQDLALLEPHLEAVELPFRLPLEKRKTLISGVYFIDAGIASMVASGSIRSNQTGIEVGIIGREGMTSLSVVLGASERSVHDIFMRVDGAGRRIPAAKLIDAIALSVTLHRPMLAHAHSFMLQASTTALANGRSRLEERLARWLLLAHDRIDGDTATSSC
jgi:CRP-like cAMP-binding protein